MKVLGIESSCDETGVAVYDTALAGAAGLRAHAVYSQIALPAPYGGVVPVPGSRAGSGAHPPGPPPAGRVVDGAQPGPPNPGPRPPGSTPPSKPQPPPAPMKVRGIESSWDETGVAVYDTALAGAAGLRAHAVYSQIALHAQYGGVGPELASRDHVRKLLPLIRQTLAEAGLEVGDLDGVAYTRSEEHTSELQSLMRTSYAVFCLKKKKN